MGEILRACSRCARPYKPRHARQTRCDVCGPPPGSPTTRTRPSSSTERARILRLVLDRDPLCQIRLPGCSGRSEVADHIVPAAEGGLYEPFNLRGACGFCNSVLGGRQSSALKHGLADRSSGPADAGGGRTAPIPPTRLH